MQQLLVLLSGIKLHQLRRLKYDIVAHSATLASGDCKAKSATDTAEYQCLYTTLASNNGAFKTIVKTTTEDKAGNALTAEYSNTASGFVLDNTAPTISITTEPAAGSAESKSAVATVTETNDYTIGYKVVDTAALCLTSVTPLTTLTPASNAVTASSGNTGDSNDFFCFVATDEAGNKGKVASATTATITGAIVITTSGLTQTIERSKTLTASSNISGTTIKYERKQNSASATAPACNNATTFAAFGSTATATYSAGISLNSEDYNYDYYCFEGTKTNYTAKYFVTSSVSGIDRTAPTQTISAVDLATADDTGSSSTDNITKNTTGLTITGTVSGAIGANDKVQLYNGGTAVGTADISLTAAHAFSIDISLANGTHSITAKVLDEAGNQGQASTALSITVDSTRPVLTASSGNFYETYSASKVFGSEYSTAVSKKAGTDIYLQTIFSENVINTISDTSSARPILTYKIGTGQATKYDIVAHDTTLASGDCRAKSATDTSEYHCFYTTVANTNGLFRVDYTNSGITDAAGNDLNANYNYAISNVTVDTIAPTLNAAVGFYSNEAASTALTGIAISTTDIYSKVIISEDVKEVVASDNSARPAIYYKIGTGTETQFSIILSGTIGDEECKETSTDGTYVCKYDVSSTDNGDFKVVLGATTEDGVGNTANKTTSTTKISIDTTAPTVSSSAYYSDYNNTTKAFTTSITKDRKSADDIYTKISFSENVTNTAC